MIFDVLDSAGDNILDPDSGLVIGSIHRPKVRLKIVTVQDKLSVARTYKTKRINVGGTGTEYIGVGEHPVTT